MREIQLIGNQGASLLPASDGDTNPFIIYSTAHDCCFSPRWDSSRTGTLLPKMIWGA